MAKTKNEKLKLQEDLEKVNIPFDLLHGFSLVVLELRNNDFSYSHLTQEQSSIFTFESKKAKQKILVSINKEDLLIRQFSMNDDNRVLKVIYVVKPSERSFKLI